MNSRTLPHKRITYSHNQRRKKKQHTYDLGLVNKPLHSRGQQFTKHTHKYIAAVYTHMLLINTPRNLRGIYVASELQEPQKQEMMEAKSTPCG